jgi:hypothetical protein
VTNLTEFATQGSKAEGAVGLAVRPKMLNGAQGTGRFPKEERGIFVYIRHITPTKPELKETLEEMEGRATLLILKLAGFNVAVGLVRCDQGVSHGHTTGVNVVVVASTPTIVGVTTEKTANQGGAVRRV